MRQVDHVRSAAFYRTGKTGIIVTGMGERHWLILSLPGIKINGQVPLRGNEQIIY